jgi:hypothetical protein
MSRNSSTESPAQVRLDLHLDMLQAEQEMAVRETPASHLPVPFVIPQLIQQQIEGP